MDEEGDDLYGAAVTSNGASQAHESSYQGATANVVKEESVPETKPAVDDEDDSDDSDDSVREHAGEVPTKLTTT